MTHIIRPFSFALAIGLSAFLLFSIELFAGRAVLPIFGGAPAVWTTALALFTAMLFLGYLAAHLVAGRASPLVATSIQLLLVSVAAMVLVLLPTDLSVLASSSEMAIGVLLVLMPLAGLPILLLAITTPLLSSWYADGGDSPWWLYAVSNAASMAALLAYPLLIEPSVGLFAQRNLAVGGLVAYALVISAVAISARRIPRLKHDRSELPRLPLRRHVIWLLAALVPAGLLSATTNFLQTDMIAAPLIWIGPLAAYLASLVIAFSRFGWRATALAEKMLPAAVVLLLVPYIGPVNWPVLGLLGVELAALLVLALAIHGRLAADRPDARQLTRFYLVLTAGGVIGTALVAFVAPLVFSDIHEYPLLVVAGLAVLGLLPRLRSPEGPAGDPASWPTTGRGPLTRALIAAAGRLAPYLAVTAILAVPLDESRLALAVVLCLGAIVVALAFSLRALTVIVSIALLVLAFSGEGPLLEARNFFGVVRVLDTGEAHLEASGTTLHGIQYLDERRFEPTSYYTRGGPVSDVMDVMHADHDQLAIGVLGLGSGVLASYAQAGDELTFFEINPAVIKIALEPAYFSYLRDTPATTRITEGDARLSLAATADSYDLLISDVFSSDSIPAHLLTREAMATYLARLRPGGLLFFHLSNRWYDLLTPVSATARSLGLSTVARLHRPPDEAGERLGAIDSLWLLVGRDEQVAPFTRLPGWEVPPTTDAVLTDDYPDLLRWLK